MTSRRTVRLVLAVCLVALLAEAALAVRPIATLRHYGFIPRRSVLNQSGGFAGVDEDYRVRGTFDLKLTPGPTDIFPIVHTAKFLNVDAWATHPVRDDVIILDDVLNLSGLEGGQVPTDPTRNLYRFTGRTENGSSVELHAKSMGRWFYLRGGTTAPAGSADLFSYHIRALAHLLPLADFNADDQVDARDLDAWTASPVLTGADFLEWQQQLGEVPPSDESLDAALDAALASAGIAAGAVPEPATLGLLSVAGAMLAAARLRRA